MAKVQNIFKEWIFETQAVAEAETHCQNENQWQTNKIKLIVITLLQKDTIENEAINIQQWFYVSIASSGI